MSGIRVCLKDSLDQVRGVGDGHHDAEAGGFYLFLPNDNAPTFWPYRDRLPNGALWRWDGDEEAPTLSPSLHLRAGKGTIWHGWLRKGILTSA